MTGFDSKRQMAQDKVAQLAQEPVTWRNAAIRLGKELSSVGPDGYYDMTAEQWLDWAMEQEPRGKNSLVQPAQEPDELTIAYMSGLYDGKKAEREACAKVCDEHNARQNLFAEERYAAHWLASAIRARGNT